MKVMASTYWGIPCLEDEGGNYYKANSVIEINAYNEVLLVKVVPVGPMVNMGHGCGSGYSSAAIETIYNGLKVHIVGWVECISELEKL